MKLIKAHRHSIQRLFTALTDIRGIARKNIVYDTVEICSPHNCSAHNVGVLHYDPWIARRDLMRRKQLDRVLREETGNYSLFLPTVRTGSRTILQLRRSALFQEDRFSPAPLPSLAR